MDLEKVIHEKASVKIGCGLIILFCIGIFGMCLSFDNPTAKTHALYTEVRGDTMVFKSMKEFVIKEALDNLGDDYEIVSIAPPTHQDYYYRYIVKIGVEE